MKKLLFMLSVIAVTGGLVMPAGAVQKHPQNDKWARATPIAFATTPTPAITVVEQSVAGATFKGDEPYPSCAGGADLQTVWFTFTLAPFPNFITIPNFSTFIEGPGGGLPLAHASDFDTVLAAYVRDNHGWHELACNDDFNGYPIGRIPQSRMGFLALDGTHTYYIQVARKVNGSPAGTHLWLEYNYY